MTWWWQFACKEACKLESITNLGYDVKNKSMQEDDVFKICVGSLIIWCKSFCEVNVSIFAPSKLVLSLMYQLQQLCIKIT